MIGTSLQIIGILFLLQAAWDAYTLSKRRKK